MGRFWVKLSMNWAGTSKIWNLRRELIGQAYRPRFIPVRFEEGGISVFAFRADHGAPDILPGISRSDQICYIATGAGFLGSSHDYLAKIIQQLNHPGIDDPACTALLRDVDAHLYPR
ncbi:MAG: hypothetical protein WD046_14335 [Paracoccaceae bacterium]